MWYMLSVVARVLVQPTASGMPWETALLVGPLWAAALLGAMLGWASLLPLQRLHQGGLHPLPVLADLP